MCTMQKWHAVSSTWMALTYYSTDVEAKMHQFQSQSYFLFVLDKTVFTGEAMMTDYNNSFLSLIVMEQNHRLPLSVHKYRICFMAQFLVRRNQELPIHPKYIIINPLRNGDEQCSPSHTSTTTQWTTEMACHSPGHLFHMHYKNNKTSLICIQSSSLSSTFYEKQ